MVNVKRHIKKMKSGKVSDVRAHTRSQGLKRKKLSFSNIVKGKWTDAVPSISTGGRKVKTWGTKRPDGDFDIVQISRGNKGMFHVSHQKGTPINWKYIEGVSQDNASLEDAYVNANKIMEFLMLNNKSNEKLKVMTSTQPELKITKISSKPPEQILFKLIKKYKPSFTDGDFFKLKNSYTPSVFVSVMKDVPHNKKARDDADEMQRLFMKMK